MSKRRIVKGIEYAILVFGVLLIAMPLFLVLITAFKSNLPVAEQLVFASDSIVSG